MKRVILFAAALIALTTGCTQIDTGNVGIATTWGKVDTAPLPQGLYQTVFTNVTEVTTKEVSFQLNDMTPKSKDNLTMQDMDIDIYYRTNPTAVPGLFIKYQGDLIRHDQLVRGGTSDYVVAYSRVSREAREAVYNSVAAFDATTMHTKRVELAAAIHDRLQKELDVSDKGAFTVTTVNVRNLVTDPAIETAIRERAKTDQQIEQKRKQIELEKAEAERKVIEAKGQADSNRILSESLTPALLQIRLAEIQQVTVAAAANRPGNTVFLGNGQVTPIVGAK